MFRIVPHGGVSIAGQDLELPRKKVAYYPDTSEIIETIKSLFDAASHYGIKYPVHRNDLLRKMDDIYWGRSGQKVRRILDAALSGANKGKLSYRDVLVLVRQEVAKQKATIESGAKG